MTKAKVTNKDSGKTVTIEHPAKKVGEALEREFASQGKSSDEVKRRKEWFREHVIVTKA